MLFFVGELACAERTQKVLITFLTILFLFSKMGGVWSLLQRAKEVIVTTLRERDTLAFIKDYIAENGYAPTMAEIADGIGIKSRGVVHRYVTALRDAGDICITPNKHRNIELMPELAQNGKLPLLGRIAAGRPIEAIPDRETVDLANIFLRDNHYALEVRGDSMIEEGILDGDVVVCQQASVANDGQIVVALVDDSETTLKRLRRNRDRTITLLPANVEYTAMTYSSDRVRIQGIFVGLLRFLAM